MDPIHPYGQVENATAASASSAGASPNPDGRSGPTSLTCASLPRPRLQAGSLPIIQPPNRPLTPLKM